MFVGNLFLLPVFLFFLVLVFRTFDLDKMSACNGFSPCRIQFTPNDEQRAARNYSDRSIIELRQYDFANYSLRALDIENNRDV
jgi:hypothetical protein